MPTKFWNGHGFKGHITPDGWPDVCAYDGTECTVGIGYCHCGCGEKTARYPNNLKKDPYHPGVTHRKGWPAKFKRGHFRGTPLSNEDIAIIRRRYIEGTTGRALAKEYNRTPTYISQLTTMQDKPEAGIAPSQIKRDPS